MRLNLRKDSFGQLNADEIEFFSEKQQFGSLECPLPRLDQALCKTYEYQRVTREVPKKVVRAARVVLPRQVPVKL